MNAGSSGVSPTGDGPLLRVRGLTKHFPGVLANDSISFDVFPGEVHALLGENGAGKSTLVKCIYGYYRRDAGEILIDGFAADLRTPQEARRRRIGMVFQNLTLIPALTVVENVALFLPDLPIVMDLPAIAGELEALGDRYHLRVDPWAHVQDLSIGQQQKAELLKLLLGQARILILDEPTRVLAPHEVEGLFQVLAHLAADGLAVIFITHKLNEVLQGADRITVLRQGRVVGRPSRAEATEDSDVDCLVLLDRVDQDDDRAVTNLAADLTWQIAGVVVSPMTMSVAEFEAWKALERRTPLEIEREGIPL